MLTRPATLLPLLVAIAFVGFSRTVSAQNPGDPATVQFGSYLSPTATPGSGPFLNSYACYPWVPRDVTIGCDVENYVYSANFFASFLRANQAIQINSFTFFDAAGTLSPITYIPNAYDVYMGAGNGPLSFFGKFVGGNPVCGTQCSVTCNYTPSPTCMPEGVAGIGSYIYDPTLGDLHIKMVETSDMAAGPTCCYWYDGGAIVTRFDGTITSSTPEPATIMLTGSGLLATLGFARRRRRETSLSDGV